MLKRLKRFMLPAVFGTALALLSPAAMYARDHDRDHHERHVRVWREHGPRVRGYFYYGPSYGYSRGYYDSWGYWHPANGYYDRWGYWHPYGY